MEEIDLEKEKKKNTRLAIVVSGVALAGAMIVYLIFFTIMFLSPFSLFKFFPIPSISINAIALNPEASGLNERLFIFSKELNLTGADFKAQPSEKTMMRLFDGQTLSKPLQIKPFHSIAQADNKLYFFDKGFYRVFDTEGSAFDEKNWEEFKNPAIGDNPKGAISSDGIWVLSEKADVVSLKLLKGERLKEIFLPLGNKPHVYSAKLLWFNNELYLFWKDKNTLFATRYNGNKWSPVESIGTAISYHILSHKDRLLLFTRTDDFKIFLWSFTEGLGWSEPEDISINEFFIDFHPAVFNERTVVLTQGLFSKKLFTVGEDRIEGRTLESPFKFIYLISLFTLIPVFIFFLIILILSLILRKYKLRHWKEDSREVEFASLLRRFLAKTIDSGIISLPMGLYLGFRALDKGSSIDNPFWILKIVFLFLLLYLIGGYLYHCLLEGLWGRTIGKRLCGIMVLKDDFTRCTLGRAFLRNLIRIIDNLFYYFVGVITITATLKWQRLGDMAGGTVVVRQRK